MLPDSFYRVLENLYHVGISHENPKCLHNVSVLKISGKKILSRRLNVISFEMFKFPWWPLRAFLLFIEIQINGLLHAKGVVILDTGHHLTFHPLDVEV